MNLAFVFLFFLWSCKSEAPSVTTAPVKDITVTTATGGGTVIDEGSAQVIERGICWSENPLPTLTSYTTINGSGIGTFASNLTNLTPKTTYHVRAFASNEAGIAYGNEEIFATTESGTPSGGLIIANHIIVDRFDNIPPYYLDQVKKMWMVYAGESHSAAIRTGLALLESINPVYDVSVTESGTPEGYNSSHLRVSRATWGNYIYPTGWQYQYGESSWYTNSTGINRTKTGISYCNSNSVTISALGYGWCWDMTEGNPTAGTDPVYGVHWYGRSIGSPEGDKSYGLDDADYAVTGNSVNLDSYLEATQSYIDYCATNAIPTVVFFTTGTVDMYTGESGYQGYLKNKRIRDYVEAGTNLVFFDYADILCYDDNGQQTTTTWNGHTYPVITPTNLNPTTTGHISNAGAVRLAKAMWWMLARIAGWDGN